MMRDDANIGRLDLHFADAVVHGTLNIDESVTSDDVQDILDYMESELLDALGIARDEMIVHVHQGRDLGAYRSGGMDGANGGGFGYN